MEVHMDLEAESIISIDTGNTNDIAESCNKLLETQEQIKTAEEKVKKLREIETVLSEQTIPNLIDKYQSVIDCCAIRCACRRRC